MLFLDTNEEERDVDTSDREVVLLLPVGVPRANLALCLPTEKEVAVEKDDAKAAVTKRRNIMFTCSVSFNLGCGLCRLVIIVE